MTKFVSIDGDWVNPNHVVSVIHYANLQPEKVVVTLTSGHQIALPEWTPRDAAWIIDKLEGRHSDCSPTGK